MPEAELPIRVESAEEQYAYMLARFGDPATWAVLSQSFDTDPDGREMEFVEARDSSGSTVTIRFVAVREAGIFGDEAPEGDGTTGFLDEVMEKAFTFSEANPPHHPGTLARFPVPSASYANSLSVAMPVIALDGGRRGLFAPPRVVVIDNSTGEAKGVGEFPGFDPEDWPPPRLGDWPPAHIQAMHRLQMQGTIMRFSAVWKRILDAWFSTEIMESPELSREIVEAVRTRAILDLPQLIPYYDRLNPVFAKWLERHSTAG
jgi:hypothetical protein